MPVPTYQARHRKPRRGVRARLASAVADLLLVLFSPEGPVPLTPLRRVDAPSLLETALGRRLRGAPPARKIGRLAPVPRGLLRLAEPGAYHHPRYPQPDLVRPYLLRAETAR